MRDKVEGRPIVCIWGSGRDKRGEMGLTERDVSSIVYLENTLTSRHRFPIKPKSPNPCPSVPSSDAQDWLSITIVMTATTTTTTRPIHGLNCAVMSPSIFIPCPCSRSPPRSPPSPRRRPQRQSPSHRPTHSSGRHYHVRRIRSLHTMRQTSR